MAGAITGTHAVSGSSHEWILLHLASDPEAGARLLLGRDVRVRLAVFQVICQISSPKNSEEAKCYT